MNVFKSIPIKSKYLLYFIGFVVILKITGTVVLNTFNNVIQSVVKIYADIILNISIYLLKLFNYDVVQSKMQILLLDEPVVNLSRVPMTFILSIPILTLLILITPSKKKFKLYGSIFLILTHLVIYVIKYSSNIVLYSTLENFDNLAIDKLTDSIPHIFFFGFVLIWFFLNIDAIILKFNKVISRTELIKKVKTLVFLMSFLILFNDILVAILPFTHYINIYTSISSFVIERFSIEISVKGPFLIGELRYIQISKYCIGVNSMFVFFAIVWLTGNSLKPRIIYSSIGIVLINLVNIIRFILLFKNIQNPDGYKRAMDLHDTYNIIIYVFIFIMWIIWFEKYSDIEFQKINKIIPKFSSNNKRNNIKSMD